MTEQEAKTFENGKRASSAARFEAMRRRRVEAGAHPADCTCTAYEDLFTCKRWNAQGMRIKKGAKAFILPLWLEKEDEDGNKKLIRTRSVVFCRCQTRTAGSRNGKHFGYRVPEDLLHDERKHRAQDDKPEDDRPADKPESGSLPQEWADQLVFELKVAPGQAVCDAMPHTTGGAIADKLDGQGITCARGQVIRTNAFDRVICVDTYNPPAPTARLVRDMLKPGGMGIGLLTNDGEPIETPGAKVESIPVGKIEFADGDHDCIVVRITKGAA